MSVLNQVLSDLAKRGAPPPSLANGVAADARAAPQSRRRAGSLRRAVWAGLTIVACATLGVYGWQAERARAYAQVARPLGAAQFAAALPDANLQTVKTAAPRPTTAAPESGPPFPAVPAPPLQDPPVPPQPPAAEPRSALSSARQLRAPAFVPNAAAATKTTATHRDVPAQTSLLPASGPVVTRRGSTEDPQLERAAELIARGRGIEAMALLTQVLGAQPTRHDARQALAALQAEAGRRDYALQTLLAGAAIEPARFAVPAARLQAELGDAPGALATLDRIPESLRDAEYDALVGGVAQRAGQHAVAVAAFARAVHSPRASASWWAGYGYSLETIGQPGQARAAFARAASDPVLPPALRAFVEQRLAELASFRGPVTDVAREPTPLAALPR